ncbi:MAG: G5 domain-containing protein [Actinomyces sp.]|uniref:aggregation-promoting factor C-terminal-like domain-containing protein n=1 Tax=Actinomyces sp. TaxID=29317 RepID=UPI0026DBD7F1|nr:G5 domain-containing protein [Actinomyces sp.]MDO4243496.1 G5 domain-containing protein [Actinomyces sp.]
MGRHSQSSSLSTTLVELGALASKSLSSTSSAPSGRRRAEGPARTSVGPVVYRAGGVAAALSLAVSGGAYAATQMGGQDVQPLSEERVLLDAIGAQAGESATEEAGSEGLTVGGEATTVSTEVEETTEAHGTVEQETDELPAGERKVATEGVDGLTRTTYQVTRSGDQEVSRETVSTVVVTAKVDEVVLVGTGTADTSSTATSSSTATASGDGTTAASAKSIAQSMMASHGWDDSQFSCLDSLWERESNWNYQAQNPSSGAYGIPQALPGSKMGSVAGDWATNPTTQITWGLGYIAERYGSPCNAWAHSESVGWY